MRSDNYFIKTGYQARDNAETVEEAFGDYWTEARIAVAGELQWYVYWQARRLVRRHSLRTVADIGCGYPAKLAMFSDCEVTVFDQKTTVSALADRFPRFHWVAVDLEQSLEPAAERHDLVICSDVIEHLLDPDPIVDRIRRLTGKWAVISTPERDYRRGFSNMRSPKPEHVREWNAKEFRRYLEASGFEVHRQYLYPQRRLSRLEFARSRILPVRSMRWSACQVAVCRPR